MRTYSYGAKAPTDNAEIVRQQICLAHRYANKLVEIERARREAWGAAGEDEAKRAAANDAAAAAVRLARAECGVYWGTYLVVEDAAQRARRAGGAPPIFRRWEGAGTIAVQMQGGMSVSDLLGGLDMRARITGTGRHRVLYLRVGSAKNRAPVWAAFPIVYHRDLPPDAKIKWARCVCRRVGTHTKWAAQFVLDGLPELALPAPTRGTVAIDVGWRKMPDGVRVAVWVDDQGAAGEVRLPALLVDRWAKVSDLRSIRDKNFNAAVAAIREWRAQQVSLPDWFREATATMHAWRATGRLAALVLQWRTARIPGDMDAYASAEAWRAQDKHLLEWEAHQRENVLRARREQYRIFARHAATYKRVVVEQLDLRDFAEKPESGLAEDPRLTASRGRRFTAALSELLGCMADAAGRSGSEWIEAPPEWTTQTCARCGLVEKWDAAVRIEHTCSRCHTTWDQDENAARNLLRAVQCGTITRGCSRQKVRAAPGESAADKRRAKGLATKRVRRSQRMTEVSEITNGK